jgi:hypothetical protein
MKHRRIEVHIEELVIDGLGALDGNTIGRWTRSELSRLIAERGLPAFATQAGGVAKINAGSFRMRGGEHAEEIGPRVARAVWEGLK